MVSRQRASFLESGAPPQVSLPSYLLSCYLRRRGGVLAYAAMTFRIFALSSLLLCPSPNLFCRQAVNTSPSAESKLTDGTALPGSGTVFVVQPGRSSAAPTQLHALEIVSNSHAAGNYARAQVFGGPHSSVELDGPAATTDFETDNLAFYVRLNGDDPEVQGSRVHLLRLQPNKKRRVVATYSQNVFGGQHKKSFEDVSVRKEQVQPGPWLKLTAQMLLSPGQYGIAFMPQDPNLFPDTVYDFAVEAKK